MVSSYSYLPLEFRRLVQKSWDKHAKARPSAEQVAFTLLKYTLDVCADSSQQNEHKRREEKKSYNKELLDSAIQN